MLRHGPLVAAMRAPLPCLPRILAPVPVFRPKFAVGNKTGSNCNQPALLRLARGMAGLDYSARAGVCASVLALSVCEWDGCARAHYYWHVDVVVTTTTTHPPRSGGSCVAIAANPKAKFMSFWPVHLLTPPTGGE